MSIEENITREDFISRGGGVELDLTAFALPEDEFLSAYQNYLGGGMLQEVSATAVMPSRIGRWMKS